MEVFPKMHRGDAALKGVEGARAKKNQWAEGDRKKVMDMKLRERWKACQGSAAPVEA